MNLFFYVNCSLVKEQLKMMGKKVNELIRKNNVSLFSSIHTECACTCIIILINQAELNDNLILNSLEWQRDIYIGWIFIS